MTTTSLSGKQNPKMLEAGRSKSKNTARTSALVLALLLAAYVALECCIPLQTTVQIGADEGFNLAKATLCLRGYELYTQVWSDQPPLHTFLITQLLKHISPSVLGPRLVTVGLTLILLAALFLIVRVVSGLLV